MLKKFYAVILLFSIALPFQSFAEYERRVNIVSRSFDVAKNLVTSYGLFTAWITAAGLHEAGVYCVLGLPSPLIDKCRYDEINRVNMCTEQSIADIHFINALMDDGIKPFEVKETGHTYISTDLEYCGSMGLSIISWGLVMYAPLFIAKKLIPHRITELQEVVVDEKKGV